MKEHPLRYMVDPNSEFISDEELDLVDSHDVFYPFASLTEFMGSLEYAGNCMLTSSLVDRDEHLTHLCCGIECFDIPLRDRTLYLAFDHGH
jgi:hypothetical protein